MDLFKLTGKTAIVTGGSRGIGKAIALRLAQAGASVVVSSRTEADCAAVAAEITDAGGKAIAVPCNVSREGEITALVEAAVSAFGPVDVLVGNAAANPYYGPLTGIEERAFDKIIDTNVKANLWLARAVLPAMAERKDGALIFISSIAGITGTDDIGAYGLSKAALSSMVRSLAVRWGADNIRVNAIAPGLVKTDFAKALWEDPARRAEAEAAYPLRRLGEPDDIAGAAVWLASPAGGFVTGQTIVVDGGITVAGARG
jgi:NAD(P)-dependent dehydrogenase (short-subunit alcohol dehydrogenase family)